MDPAQLRRDLRARGAALPAAERERQGAACVAALQVDQAIMDAPALLSYAALQRECPVDGLHPWWLETGRAYLLPLVEGKAMRWFAVGDLQTLVTGSYGIREPNPELHPECLDIPNGSALIAPGVAFGPNGLRLGQGGGFYDRFLDKNRSGLGPVIGVGFDHQWSDSILAQDHDQAVDRVCLAGVWR